MHPAQHALLTELLQQWYDEARSGIDDTCYDEIVAIHLARLHTQAAAWQARITATFGVPLSPDPPRRPGVPSRWLTHCLT